MDKISFVLEKTIGVIRKVSRDLFHLVSMKLRCYTGNINFPGREFHDKEYHASYKFMADKQFNGKEIACG
jgi:hypothetical protein